MIILVFQFSKYYFDYSFAISPLELVKLGVTLDRKHNLASRLIICWFGHEDKDD